MFDPKNALSVTQIIGPKSQTNNTGAGVLDLRDYIGPVAVVVQVGTKSAGDADATISLRVTTSATNNISNGVNYGTATVNTSNNTTALDSITVDTRDAYRYLFAVPTITGTNSPAYPLSVLAVGQKRVR